MRRAFLVFCALAMVSAVAGAQAAAPDIYTRGEYRGSFEEDGGRRLFARIKLAPGAKIPFSTLTYRVLDPALLQGLADGAPVEFKAVRDGSENVLTVIRPRAVQTR